MLKGIRDLRLDNQKVLRAPGPTIQYFKCLFCHLINYNFRLKFIFLCCIHLEQNNCMYCFKGINLKLSLYVVYIS